MKRPLNIVDMHCHIDRMKNGVEVAQELAERGAGVLNATVLPSEYQEACDKFASVSNVWVGCGLHPWWIANGTASSQDIEGAAALASECPIVGEIGLDFSARFAGSEQRQLKALASVLDACAERPIKGRIVTIHATKAVGCVLNMLRDRDLIATGTCIFHWFRARAMSWPRQEQKDACFPSTNACSKRNAGASTHGRYRFSSSCSKPMRPCNSTPAAPRVAS